MWTQGCHRRVWPSSCAAASAGVATCARRRCRRQAAAHAAAPPWRSGACPEPAAWRWQPPAVAGAPFWPWKLGWLGRHLPLQLQQQVSFSCQRRQWLHRLLSHSPDDAASLQHAACSRSGCCRTLVVLMIRIARVAYVVEFAC